MSLSFSSIFDFLIDFSQGFTSTAKGRSVTTFRRDGMGPPISTMLPRGPPGQPTELSSQPPSRRLASEIRTARPKPPPFFLLLLLLPFLHRSIFQRCVAGLVEEKEKKEKGKKKGPEGRLTGLMAKRLFVSEDHFWERRERELGRNGTGGGTTAGRDTPIIPTKKYIPDDFLLGGFRSIFRLFSD